MTEMGTGKVLYLHKPSPLHISTHIAIFDVYNEVFNLVTNCNSVAYHGLHMRNQAHPLYIYIIVICNKMGKERGLTHMW